MSLKARTVNILGVTGSIGQSAVDVIASDPARFEVQAVTAHENAEALAKAAIRLNAQSAVIADERHLAALKDFLGGKAIEAQGGAEALDAAAAMPADLTLAAIIGFAGLKPLMMALKNSRAVAIANKEPLVAAGPFVMREAAKHGTKILPVDSEHNAIFQVFDFERPEGIERLILTASGGPFRSWEAGRIAKASVQEALAHPNWSMGRKITVDSATMMNKALEVIEAHYLFGLLPEKIEVIIHPQSVIHSMVEYKDGSVLAQMGASDMRTPLAHVLAWPERMTTPGQRLDLKALGQLSFEPPDTQRFPALKIVYDVLREGPESCIIFNAANEIGVNAFLNGQIGFGDIMRIVEYCLQSTESSDISGLEDICDLDRVARESASSYINSGLLTKTVATL